MTLKELIDSVSRLKIWKIISEHGTPGFDVPQAGSRKQFVSVAEFKDERQPMVRFTTRIGPADRLEPTRLHSALDSICGSRTAASPSTGAIW